MGSGDQGLPRSIVLERPECRRLIDTHIGCSLARSLRHDRPPRVTPCMLQGMAERDRLIEVVRRIMTGDYADEAEVSALAADVERSVLHPRATGPIFWPGDEFDHDPTPEEMVDRALSYRPIAP